MNKVYVSRWVNMYLFDGSPDEMLSSRIHREQWWCESLVDLVFFWHVKHCERAYRWEKKHAP